MTKTIDKAKGIGGLALTLLAAMTAICAGILYKTSKIVGHQEDISDKMNVLLAGGPLQQHDTNAQQHRMPQRSSV